MIDLTVKTLDSQNHAFSLEDDQITVRGFKEYIAESVAVPADSQRLIYCGRVLQDEKKLNDYDVNGKVIHLVQRAPPEPGQQGNEGGQSQGQNHGQARQTMQTLLRTHYRLTRAQMQANAMYLGAMAVPAEIVEGHGSETLLALGNSLSSNRLDTARYMLERANELIDRLDVPNCPLNPPSTENNQPPLGEQVHVHDIDSDQDDDEVTAAAVAAALSAAGANVTLLRGSTEQGEVRPTLNMNDSNQTEAQQQHPQSEQQGSTSNAEGQSNRRAAPQYPGRFQMAELLQRLLNMHEYLRPYMERYCALLRSEVVLPPGPGPDGVEENQRVVDGVSEILHFMSHACHALADIILDMGQEPPRRLRCRPIMIQHSAILQPGIPIQVEAHINLPGRSANNNNGNEESSEASSNLPSRDSQRDNAGDSNPQQQSDNASEQRAEQRQQQQQPDATQSPFGAVFNLPNNVEVLMEVSPASNMDGGPGGEQPPTGETNNNNTNGARIAAGAFPWGAAPPPDFIRNIVQAVAGHVVIHQGGITGTTLTARNPPITVAGQQPIVTSHDSGSTTAGQSTQARSNVGTHPTTSTQTRSTSRPHVFQQQAQHLVGIGQGLHFDPFLPCNSHHVRRAPTAAPSTVTAMSQGSRANPTPTSEAQTQTQPSTTSTTTSTAGSSNSTPPTTSQANPTSPFINLLHQMLGGSSGQAVFTINGNNPTVASTLGNIMPLVRAAHIRVGFSGDRSGNAGASGLTLADLLESRMGRFAAQNAGGEQNFLVNLYVLVMQNITIEGLIRLRIGQWEPLAQLRGPLQDFFEFTFPNTTPEVLQEQAINRLLTELRPDLQELLASEEDASGRGGSRIDICATIESLLRQHIKDVLRILFNNDIDDARFGQEILTIVNHLGRQSCAILRYSIRGGQAGLEAVASRFVTDMLEGIDPAFRQWMLNGFIVHFRTYSLRVAQPPDSEILPLLVYKDVAPQASSATPSPAHRPSHAESEAEPMETEATEERTSHETAVPNDGEDIPEDEALPSDWIPIIERDRTRQRRQIHMSGMLNGGVATFSDAYLGGMPTKRRKIIEQQKPRLLASPTPNHSAIEASMERLVREGVSRAGVGEIEGAAVAVAADPGVRRAFGQAIRDCIDPRIYRTQDIPDHIRFPNASKYFIEEDRPPK